jgi:transposase-like protein
MNTYKRYRFPPDIISYTVWLYYRFNLSHRDIEDLLAERGIIVSRDHPPLVYRVWVQTCQALETEIPRLRRRLLHSLSGLIQPIWC